MVFLILHDVTKMSHVFRPSQVDRLIILYVSADKRVEYWSVTGWHSETFHPLFLTVLSCFLATATTAIINLRFEFLLVMIQPDARGSTT